MPLSLAAAEFCGDPRHHQDLKSWEYHCWGSRGSSEYLGEPQLLEAVHQTEPSEATRPMTCLLCAKHQEGWRREWEEVRGWLGVRSPHCPWGDRPAGKIISGQREMGKVRTQWSLKADSARAHLALGREGIGGTAGGAETRIFLQHLLGFLLCRTRPSGL